MQKRYLVVSQDKEQIGNVWRVEDDDIQLRTSAIRLAKERAKDYPNRHVEVWVDIVITERLERIQ